MENEIKMSKELLNIAKAIEKYIDKHEGNVSFYASFIAFEGKDFDVIDDRVFAFGPKETLLIDLNESVEMLKKEKDDFINW